MCTPSVGCGCTCGNLAVESEGVIDGDPTYPPSGGADTPVGATVRGFSGGGGISAYGAAGWGIGFGGANGGGGVGYAFSGGEVLSTFPNIGDQMRYVYYGTAGYNLAGVSVYGNPDREGGAHVTGGQGNMPVFGGQLTGYELLGVICHERYTLGGADPTSEEWEAEFELYCSAESPVFEALEAGEIDLADAEVEPVTGPDGESVEIELPGPEPIAGQP